MRGWFFDFYLGFLLIYIADTFFILWHAKSLVAGVRERGPEVGVIVLLGVALLVWFWEPALVLAWVHKLSPSASSRSLVQGLAEIGVISFLILQILRFQASIFVSGFRPEFILTGSFLLLIFGGTLLLLLPRSAANPDQPLGFVNALFTATSASCVTGLVVRDTGTGFSLMGQGIILMLFQLGGLGIMTFVAFMALYSSRSLPLPQMLLFQKVLAAGSLDRLKRQAALMLGITLAIEFCGAVWFYLWLPGDWNFLRKVWWSIFHAVSAFCNAGFALQGDSLVFVKDQAALMLGFMILIIVGGLGFLVLPDLMGIQVSRLPIIRKIPAVRQFNLQLRNKRISVQAKLAVAVSAGLLALGFMGMSLLESGHALESEPGSTRILIAAFQSVTARTAGFNTVPIHELQDATLILLMALMVVGACPVSTGGGIKTVTFGILVLTLKAMITGRARVEVFNRAIPQKVIVTALSITILYTTTAILGVFALAVLDPPFAFQDQLFEVISALSTVGLSTGITANLGAGSKLILCFLMFIGRVGPLTLILSVFRSHSTPAYEYPEENLIVG